MATYRKRGNNWEYRIRYTVNGELKTISKGGFKTKTEARVEATNIENELHRGTNLTMGDKLFTEYYENWINTYKIGAFSPETDKFYKGALKLVKKHFEGVKLKDISRKSYQDFLNEYSIGRSKETVRKAHTKVGACLKDAFYNGYIPLDPSYRPTIRGKDGVKESSKFLHKEEAKKLLEALKENVKLTYVSRYMLILQFATGARISEIMAITFDDLNFKKNTLKIDKSWDYKFYHDFKPTKNHEERTITIDQETIDIIKPFYEYQKNKKLVDNKNRLFASHNKIPSINAINKSLKRACIRADIPVVTSHALRHTHASLLLMNDINIAYISRRLGHKDITITTEVYSHLLKELEMKNEKESIDFFETMYK